jgi:hypothetical protein
VDRLIALVGLRVRLGLRVYLRARETLLGLLLALPGILIFSGLFGAFLFFGIRLLGKAHPEALVAAVSAGATLAGVAIAFAPLLAGVGAVETPDIARLAHFPVPFGSVVAASVIANLMQPAVLGQGLIALAVALALGGSLVERVLALVGVGLTHLLIIAAAQAVGLVLHGLSRNRRLLDVVLVLTLPLGFAIGLAPFLFLVCGLAAADRLLQLLAATDVFAFSPFAWGARAAVHGGRGEIVPFLVWLALAALALAAIVALSAVLMGRIHRSEWRLGRAASAAPRAHRPWPLPGAVGALVEKDLRALWREPAAKASLFLGLIGPFILLVFFTRGSEGVPPSLLLPLAVFAGISPLGANAFGLERRGVQLLLTLPVPRAQILLAKNMAYSAMRAPSLGALALVVALLSPPALLPTAAVIVANVWLVASGMDNLHSVLFPVALPGPERNPYAKTSGGRGLGAALVGMAFVPATLIVVAPFVFLAWLPFLLHLPRLVWIAQPLALVATVGVYAMLLGGAAHLLTRREPELVSRILGDV